MPCRLRLARAAKLRQQPRSRPRRRSSCTSALLFILRLRRRLVCTGCTVCSSCNPIASAHGATITSALRSRSRSAASW